MRERSLYIYGGKWKISEGKNTYTAALWMRDVSDWEFENWGKWGEQRKGDDNPCEEKKECYWHNNGMQSNAMIERKISNCELLNMNQEIPNMKLIKGTRITELKTLNQF